MANRENHRKPLSDNNRKKTHRRPAKSDGGAGANGARGLTDWKRLSSQSERRTAGQRVASIAKRKGNPAKNMVLEGDLDMSADRDSIAIELGFSEDPSLHKVQRYDKEDGGVRITCLVCPDIPSVESEPRTDEDPTGIDEFSTTSIVSWTKQRDQFLAEHAR